jgi:hypothetical protein
MSKEITQKSSTDLSAEMLDDIFEHEGLGADFTSEEMQMPFIRIAQAMSPEVKKSDAKFIDGCGQGDVFNNLTKEFWSEGVEVIPCHVKTMYTEWVSRDEGGGFVREIDPTDPILQQTRMEGSIETLPDSTNNLVKADNYVVLVKSSDGSWNPAVLDMKSTQLKISRRWKTQLNLQTIKHPKTNKTIKSPIFCNRWLVKTIEEKNKQGQSYFNYSISNVGLITDRETYEKAKSLYTASSKGEIKTQSPEQGAEQTENKEQKIPF